ncbi:MAG: DUF3048 domain-containing protein [Armatimonadetes bacterium]|nr:DUF3048 domain-containing protein [Armatimonadota bacterium]
MLSDPALPRRSWRRAWPAMALLILMLSGLAGCARQPASPPAPFPPEQVSAPDVRPPGGRLLAVMVENHRAARPQSGLDRADVVFEALVEGGITRFLAIYSRDDAPVIGPVRSARPYFVSLAQPFDPIYVHCGESNSGIRAIQDAGVADLDQMLYAGAFWRDHRRRKPHNLYTSTERLWRYAERLAYQRSPVRLPFTVESVPPAGEPALGVDIGYHYGERYEVRWRYDPSSGFYRRFINGAPHTDAVTGRQLVANTIYLLQTPTQLRLATTGELEVQVLGTGNAWLLRDGRLVRGTWSRTDDFAPFDLFAEDGSPMAAKPGPIWVQIIPSTRQPRFALRQVSSRGSR